MSKKHPSLDIVSSDGTGLAGKKIILCISGSVAAYKSIELARLLMRHGADVICVASKAATDLIKPSYFKWATGNQVITKLTGDLEHIKVADYKQSDLIIVYPCTANTLGKLANGIDDTPISTVLSVGLGSKIPIIIALAMHQAMYENPAVINNVEFLKNKVDFISPKFIEGKAKAAEPEEILDLILQKFGLSPVLKGKKVLITAGPTIEYIDPVRVITNQSTGKTGVLLASEFVSAGCQVTLIYGPGTEAPPKGAKLIRVQTSGEMGGALRKEMRQKWDIIILAAAISDYTPEKPHRAKINSDLLRISLKLKRVPKMINDVKKIQRDVFLVGFKAEANIPKRDLINKAREKIVQSDCDLVIANDIGTKRYRKNPDYNNVISVDSKTFKESGWKNKSKIVKFIRNEIEKRID
ncbi:bifunctional phosphopantothenoylcysteine decarboxylase/phosphopantothenate--cysteine ligase CoaBC [Candidatus Nitrosotalea okcheonensis]|uniref:Coenzyme A biosynthesis bifunctional protein CoaBC n=1 Tax=Candidatus Nitrosotalea okcheonensis TaxID=1903276 RepID=A0A2H1FGW5_9ARCH|nr:bifunctional phosphopantothenoylcysteine decarboxylase/phosphopantothenate--cysteine ligase CoaBC [Candidatus Nitrosotalea okcheonensis]SMH71997.1 Phosphopantothenoylcysteine decarboxylase/phosphopantothenate--cysteine ligase [Candidatus Nitrosotalea okcheonensis]